MDDKDIENRFKHHPPANQDVADMHNLIRNLHRDLAYKVNDLVPDSREKSLAITKLEEAMYWTNAAIARS